MEDEDQNISFYENLVAISGFTKCLLASTYAYLLRKKNKIQIAQGLANLALEQKSYDKIYTRRWLSIKNQRGKESSKLLLQSSQTIIWWINIYYLLKSVLIKQELLQQTCFLPGSWFIWLLWLDVFYICGIIKYNIINKCNK